MTVLKEYYKDLAVEELVMDDFFIKSVECPNEASDSFWKEVVLQYPQQEGTIEEAKEIVRSLVFRKSSARPGSKERVWESIVIAAQKDVRFTVRDIAFSKWFWAAASVLLILAAGIVMWWQFIRVDSPSFAVRVKDASEILPGKNGAILTLTNGEQVVLDTVNNGMIATQNGTNIILKGGSLFYNNTNVPSAGEIAYNTVTTPKGRQFHLQLPDGTGVWLNAASAIRYPVSFSGTERRVEIHGEVYFEVAQNERIPFKVKVNQSLEILVLGTQFNINAYDEASSIKTSLLEGSIKVIANQSHLSLTSSQESKPAIVLKPGQQVQVSAVGPPKLITDLDMTSVIAWKNGLFDFENADLKEVMQQLSRWYDIDVVYEGQVPDVQFGGKMSRNITLSGVLKILEKTGVHFRLEEGRKLKILSE